MGDEISDERLEIGRMGIEGGLKGTERRDAGI